jgi:hypothetical protein
LGWVRRGRAKASGGPAESRIPRFEQLESRILLSADYGIADPVDSFDPYRLNDDQPAIYMDLTPGSATTLDQDWGTSDTSQAGVLSCRPESILSEVEGSIRIDPSTLVHFEGGAEASAEIDPSTGALEGNPSSPTATGSVATKVALFTLNAVVAATEIDLSPASAGVVEDEPVEVLPV